MKILHTADLHLGAQLKGYDRWEEQQYTLQQIKNIALEERPDAFVICGDIYNVAKPSNALQRSFHHYLLELYKAVPSMKIVVIGGNHDSRSGIDVPRDLLDCLDISMLGGIDTEHLDSYVVDAGGKGWIVAVPYFPDSVDGRLIFARLLSMAAERDPEGRRPVVLLAHLAVQGCDFRGHEVPADVRQVGNLQCQETAYLGEGYDYCALGHIHKGQTLEGGRIRYSGTPLQMSFDEDYPHTVTIVEIDRHGEMPVIREIELEPRWRLVTIPPKGALPWSKALEALRERPDASEYIRVNVDDSELLPGNAKEQAADTLSDARRRICYVQLTRSCIAAASATHKSMSVDEVREITPIDLVNMWRNASPDNMRALPDSLMPLLEDAIREALDDASK